MGYFKIDYKPKGVSDAPFNPKRCKAAVQDTGRWSWRFYQCTRKALENGYCKQHAGHSDKKTAI